MSWLHIFFSSFGRQILKNLIFCPLYELKLKKPGQNVVRVTIGKNIKGIGFGKEKAFVAFFMYTSSCFA
jgi:hypothetical protein